MATLTGKTIASTYTSLLKLDGDTGSTVAGASGNAIQVKTGDNEATPVYLNTDRVGIGTATPEQKFHMVGGNMKVESTTTTDNTPTIEIKQMSTTSSHVGGNLTFGRGDPGAVLGDNINLGDIIWYGQAPPDSAWIDGARIIAQTDGTPGEDSMPTELQFWTNSGSDDATQKMCILANGKVGIATSTPSTELEIAASNGHPCLSIYQYNSANGSPFIRFGGVDANTSDSIDSVFDWGIGMDRAGSSTAEDALTFCYASGGITNPGNSNAVMSMLTNGKVGIGIATPTAKLHMSSTDADIGTMFKMQASNASMDATSVFMDLDCTSDADISDLYFAVFQDSDGHIGSIRCSSASAVAFNTSSDYRLKENFANITDGLTRVNQLKPKKFNFKKDSNKIVWDGLVAHEASAIIPYAVMGEKDAMDKKVIGHDSEGNDITKDIILPQAIDYGKLTPLLIAAIQELSAKVTALENK